MRTLESLHIPGMIKESFSNEVSFELDLEGLRELGDWPGEGWRGE